MPGFVSLRFALIALFTILLSGCSSDLIDTASEAVSADGAPTVTDADAADDDEASSTPATSTSLPPESTTTFVPALDGPFDLSGGASFDRDAADVIIDDDPDLTGTLSGLSFPTDWTRRTVEDWSEFLAGLGGSDPRDGIPPIDDPVFETPALASQWLTEREPGALVQLDGDARFYPLSILTRHEIVNDAFGDVPVAVTYCPLCNTAIAFDRRVNGEVLRFGVSGLLRNSDLVMWDDATTSLWQQITGTGVVGDFAGAQLETVSTSIVSFGQFRENFPDGKSLAADSGFGRNTYGINPYVGYSSSDRPFLFDGTTDDRLPALNRVVGVTIDEGTRAYSFAQVQEAGAINDEIGGRPIVVLGGGDTADALDDQVIGLSEAIGTAVAYDPVVDGQTLTFSRAVDGSFTDEQTGSTWTVLGRATAGPLADEQLETVVHRNEFWFAWQAFFGPDTLWEG